MTDNDIVKALECHSRPSNSCGSNCPYLMCEEVMCTKKLSKDALDLINRQKAEIEKNEKIIRLADKTIETANAEIEQWKEEANKYQNNWCKSCNEIERLNVDLQAMRGAANSYKAEVERLEGLANHHRAVIDELNNGIAEARAEAYKEFAEKLKTEYNDFDEENEVILPENIFKAINDTLKELVGEQVE